MIKVFLLTAFTVLASVCFAQVKWGMDEGLLSGREWSNYSTTYIPPEDENISPVLVTAIPYNGIYSHNDEYGLALSMSFAGAFYSFTSRLSKGMQQLVTYDSSNVYFITPGIHPENAALYEYRVLLNGKTELTPWSVIKKFTDDDFQLNNFKKHLGFIGGYKTVWENSIVVELRKKGSDSLLTASAVYWQQARPKLLQIYTADDLGNLLSLLKTTYNPYIPQVPEEELQKWQKKYTRDQIDPVTHLPKKLILQPGEKNVLFYLTAGVYKKEAIEYQLLKDGDIKINWKPNDYTNSFISLKNLTHGNYLLRLRYGAQRHNITEYPFMVEPAWYQTGLFKLTTGILIAAFAGAFYLYYRLVKQKRKTGAEEAKKKQLALELKAIHAQLNPHFIFNSLNSIQGLINTNDIKEANQYLSEFGSLMRSTLTGTEENFTTLTNELATLDSYLKLEQLRFGFNYLIETDSGINASETDMPFLLLQPLVENAVKHGVSGLQEEGNILVTFSRQYNNMTAAVQDNGNGFADAYKTNGYGLKLTRERITLLNQVTGSRQMALEISSNATTGTTIKIIFSNWLA